MGLFLPPYSRVGSLAASIGTAFYLWQNAGFGCRMVGMRKTSLGAPRESALAQQTPKVLQCRVTNTKHRKTVKVGVQVAEKMQLSDCFLNQKPHCSIMLRNLQPYSKLFHSELGPEDEYLLGCRQLPQWCRGMLAYQRSKQVPVRPEKSS